MQWHAAVGSMRSAVWSIRWSDHGYGFHLHQECGRVLPGPVRQQCVRRGNFAAGIGKFRTDPDEDICNASGVYCTPVLLLHVRVCWIQRFASNTFDYCNGSDQHGVIRAVYCRNPRRVDPKQRNDNEQPGVIRDQFPNSLQGLPDRCQHHSRWLWSYHGHVCHAFSGPVPVRVVRGMFGRSSSWTCRPIFKLAHGPVV